MEKRPINPWTWQIPYNFSQAWKIDNCQSMVFVSGQASLSSDGEVLHEEDFRFDLNINNFKVSKGAFHRILQEILLQVLRQVQDHFRFRIHRLKTRCCRYTF